jgi:arylsulfatase
MGLTSGGCRRHPPAHDDVQTVILVTLDTTRADHLGCYGYERPTSPRLDRFAEEALLYENMVATGTWTLPSHASLFTGKFTASHGARNDPKGSLALSDAIPTPESSRRVRLRTIAASETTLAMMLTSAGFETGAIVAGPYLKRAFGLARGFAYYDDANIGNLNGRRAEDVTYRALVWLERTSGRRFLFLNYFDPHVPLWPPEGFATAFRPEGLPALDQGVDLDAKLRLYDAEILYMDHHLGRLFDGLKELGLYDRALIVVTGDHGEAFGEHGEWAHAGKPFQSLLRIPLIVKQPGGAGPIGTTGDWTSLVDVVPLILDRVGVAVPDDVQGGIPPSVGHPIIAESHTYGAGALRALIDPDGVKLIANDRGARWLFDLRRDPHEEHNLAETQGRRMREMQQRLGGYLDSLPPPGPQPPPTRIDRETEETLRSLGYID